MNIKNLQQLIKLIGNNIASKNNKYKNLLKKNREYLNHQYLNFKENHFKPLNTLTFLQDWLEKKVQSDGQEVVLRQSAIWARGITWSFIGGTAFGIAWLGLAKTEEIIVATGQLTPLSGVVDVQMPVGGVASQILIKEGDLVKKGQILLELNNEVSNAKLDAIRRSIDINQEIDNGLETLVEEGAISRIQYLQHQNKLSSLKSELIESEVANRYQTIIAPADGRIFDLKPWGPGYVARSTEPILKIVPLDNLEAKIEIESRHIGFINIGKTVDISIDSFPASDFGVIEGTLKRIGSDALPPDPALGKGFRFPAIVNLETQYLKLKNGNKLPLQTGMSLSANIKLRKVSYLQLLLNTFSDKTDSLRTL
jgi:hemolysin D